MSMGKKIIKVDGRLTVMVLEKDRWKIPDGLISTTIYTELE
jgi:hypothetical protein